MRYQLTCDVVASIKLDAGAVFMAEDCEVNVTVTKARTIDKVAVSKRIPVGADVLPKFTTTDAGPMLVVTRPDEVHDELIGLLQYLEGMFAIYFFVRRVKWETATTEWIPESEEERLELAVFSIRAERTFEPEAPRECEATVIYSICKVWKQVPEALNVYLAFLRKGMAAYEDFDFIWAFYNFYYVVEGMFSGGKTKNRDIERAFLASPELVSIVAMTVDSWRADDSQHNRWLGSRVDLGDREDVAPRTIRLLVNLRGQLHHFIESSSRQQPNPLRQDEWMSAAYLMQCVALGVLTARLSQIESAYERGGRIW